MVGYIGIGKYNCTENGHLTEEYKKWISMMRRCYDNEYLKRQQTYLDATICKEWHNFQNFSEWYLNNKWCDDIKLCVDKDILIKGNKIYSPSTCILVPSKINNIFTKHESKRGKHIIGVTEFKGKLVAQCSNGNRSKPVHLGYFKTELEAFNAYKQFKESYIKQVADDYDSKYPNFPKRLYDAMYNYEVEITD